VRRQHSRGMGPLAALQGSKVYSLNHRPGGPPKSDPRLNDGRGLLPPQKTHSIDPSWVIGEVPRGELEERTRGEYGMPFP